MLISGRKYKMKLKFGYNKGYTPPSRHWYAQGGVAQ